MKKIQISVLTIIMLFIVINATVVFASSKKVYVRIEGTNKTLMPRTQVTVDYFDLAPYGINSSANEEFINEESEVDEENGIDEESEVDEENEADDNYPSAFHALVAAIDSNGHDPLDKRILNNNSGYITNLYGLSNTDSESWMYLVNNQDPGIGLVEYNLSDGDDIVLYYIDWMYGNVVFFAQQQHIIKTNEDIELTLEGYSFDDMWTEPYTLRNLIPIENADILVSTDKGTSAEIATEYKTNKDGLVNIKFTVPGVYSVSATRLNDNGIIDISRPYCRVTVIRNSSSTSSSSGSRKSTSTETNVVNSKVATEDIQKIVDDIIKYYNEKDERSDWEEISLILNGADISESKLLQIREKIKEDNIRNITDLAKLALLLQIAGIDITNFDGVDLSEKIANNENMGRQGLNGYIFSLIVLGNIMSIDEKANIDTIIEKILDYQNTNGGFPLVKGSDSNADITAMAITALAPYKENSNIKSAIDKALLYFNNEQADKGYDAYTTSETLSQFIISLTSLGIDPEDENYIKNGKSAINKLLSFLNEDGKFSHIAGEKSDDIATEQAMLALTSYLKYLQQELPIYVTDKNPTIIIKEIKEIKTDIAPDIVPEEDKEIIMPNDLDDASHWAQHYIKTAYELQLVVGDSSGNFNPKNYVTRAEFIIMLLNIINEKQPSDANSKTFDDVENTAWYAKYIEEAASLGLITGTADNRFMPNNHITRQDMAVIINNSFNLSENEASSVKDLDQASEYARKSITTVVANNIMSGMGDRSFNPQGKVTREMAATVIVNTALSLNIRTL